MIEEFRTRLQAANAACAAWASLLAQPEGAIPGDLDALSALRVQLDWIGANLPAARAGADASLAADLATYAKNLHALEPLLQRLAASLRQRQRDLRRAGQHIAGVRSWADLAAGIGRTALQDLPR